MASSASKPSADSHRLGCARRPSTCGLRSSEREILVTSCLWTGSEQTGVSDRDMFSLKQRRFVMTRFALAVLLTLMAFNLVEISLHSSAISAQSTNTYYAQATPTPTPSPAPTSTPTPSPSPSATPVPEPEPAPSRTPTPSMNFK